MLGISPWIHSHEAPALEDAFGLHVNGGNSSLDPHTAEGLLRSYARSATGAPI